MRVSCKCINLAIEEYLPNQDTTARSHRRLDCTENLDAVIIRPIMDDVAQPVHIRVRGRVGLEKVVLHELHAARLQSRRVLARPDLRLRLFESRGAVLDDELQIGVKVRQLETETACHLLVTMQFLTHTRWRYVPTPPPTSATVADPREAHGKSKHRLTC